MKYLQKSIMFILLVTVSIQALDNFVALQLPLHAIILNSDYTVSDQITAMKDVLQYKKVDINAVDRDGKTALNLATYLKKDPKLIQFLIDQGAQVDQPDLFNETPLINSVRYDQAIVAKMLLDNGADEFHKNDDGQNSIDLARTKSTKAALGL